MKSVPRKKFIAFLKAQGLVHIRTRGGHEQWDNPTHPLERTITLRTTGKDIPLLHIHTTLKTLGMTKEDFEAAMRDI